MSPLNSNTQNTLPTENYVELEPDSHLHFSTDNTRTTDEVSDNRGTPTSILLPPDMSEMNAMLPPVSNVNAQETFKSNPEDPWHLTYTVENQQVTIQDLQKDTVVLSKMKEDLIQTSQSIKEFQSTRDDLN